LADAILAGIPHDSGPAALPSGSFSTSDDCMPHAHLTAAVRSRVAQVFARLGITDENELRETILIRSGAYCGRRFDTVAGHAIWFVEENQIKFYDAAGSLAEVVATDTNNSPQRIAA
jgi:hypothetical protein